MGKRETRTIQRTPDQTHTHPHTDAKEKLHAIPIANAPLHMQEEKEEKVNDPLSDPTDHSQISFSKTHEAKVIDTMYASLLPMANFFVFYAAVSTCHQTPPQDDAVFDAEDPRLFHVTLPPQTVCVASVYQHRHNSSSLSRAARQERDLSPLVTYTRRVASGGSERRWKDRMRTDTQRQHVRRRIMFS